MLGAELRLLRMLDQHSAIKPRAQAPLVDFFLSLQLLNSKSISLSLPSKILNLLFNLPCSPFNETTPFFPCIFLLLTFLN